jgi:DNA-binding transcriptional LysR family regulator
MKWNLQMGRRLKLRNLHYLLTVVQAGSMAKAATQLSVSQPVISNVIADMEHLLGGRLLDRSPRGVEPTIYGRQLLASSYAIFDELRQGVIEIEHLSDPAAGELSIGCNEASTLGIVPAAIDMIRRERPRFFMQVVLANTPAEQRRELMQRKIELAVGRVWASGSDYDLETELLFEQQFIVMAGRHSPWARRRRVELAEMIDGPWVIPPLKNLSGQLVAEVFQACGLRMPRSHVVTSSLQLTQRLLEDGPFLALLPTSILQPLTKYSTLKVLPVPLPELSSPIGIIKLRNRRLSPVAEIFIEAARAVARSMPDNERLMGKQDDTLQRGLELHAAREAADNLS